MKKKIVQTFDNSTTADNYTEYSHIAHTTVNVSKKSAHATLSKVFCNQTLHCASNI